MGLESPEAERGPAVLIVGGLLTSWLWYCPFRGRIRRRGASHVAIAHVWLRQWVLAAFVGPARSASVVADAIDRLYAEEKRPILVVGHSGGGILARLALAREPFDGTRLARRDAVGAVVTLGTPHQATRFDGTIGRHGLRALRFLQALDEAPGPSDPWATLSVGGRLPEAPPAGGSLADRLRRRLTAWCYRALLGPKGAGAPGDGLVPLECAILPRAEELRLPGVAHAPIFGTPWYFSEEGVAKWWARAFEFWQGAVIARSTAGPEEKGTGSALDSALQSDA